MKRSIIIISISATMLGASSCATVGGAVDKAKSVAAAVVLPVPEEIRLGQQMSKEVEKEAKLHPSRDVQAYVQRVGRNVAAKAVDTPKGIKYTFKVIDDDKQVNAFALPGGHIYVFTGLLKLMDDEAELAAVLSHEVAHVSNRHIAERLATMYGVQMLTTLALGQNPGALKQIAAQVAQYGTLVQFTRGQESEADAKGLPYLIRAGYDPNGMVRLFAKMSRGEGPKFAKFLQDHPLPSERVAATKQRVARLKNKPTKTNEGAYQRFEDEI
jgi:beta-barrel assembly-enhancing protease